MFVPPSALKFVLIHRVAFPTASLVARTIVDENKQVFSLKAIMLKESWVLRFKRAASKAFFVFSRGPPRMLLLISTINTTSFLKTYKDHQNRVRIYIIQLHTKRTAEW